MKEGGRWRARKGRKDEQAQGNDGEELKGLGGRKVWRSGRDEGRVQPEVGIQGGWAGPLYLFAEQVTSSELEG